MPTLHAATALTPQGWRADVRIAIEGGAIASVEPGVPPQRGDERHAIVIPAIANLHSHAFQRAMAGLAETRGPGHDTFWTWRETMYRFALLMNPDDVEAVAAQLYVEMLEAGFGAVAEFHYLHHAPDGTPYATPAEMAERIVAAARETGIGLTLLPVFYAHATFGGAPPRSEQRRFISDVAGFARLVEDCDRLRRRRRRRGRRRAAQPARRDAGGACRRRGACARRPDPHPCRRAGQGGRGLPRLVGRAAGRAGSWTTPKSTNAGVSSMRPTWRRTRRARVAASGAVVGLCPITEANLGDGVFGATEFLGAGGRFGVGTDSNVSIGAARRNCASSNIRNA